MHCLLISDCRLVFGLKNGLDYLGDLVCMLTLTFNVDGAKAAASERTSAVTKDNSMDKEGHDGGLLDSFTYPWRSKLGTWVVSEAQGMRSQHAC